VAGPERASLQDATAAEIRRQIAHIAWPGLVAVGVFLVLGTEAYRWPWQLHLLALALVFLGVLTWAMLQRWYLPAVWLLILGCLAASLLAAHWFPSSGALCLLAVPTALAALLTGLSGGIGVAALCTLAVLIMSSLSATTSLIAVPALIAVWATAGVTCGSVHFAREPSQALWTGYMTAHQLLEQARNQRLELKQTQEDLVQANEELARLSERLARMYQVAEEARRAKEEFVANVSHELRTPLNMITGFAEMISDEPDAYGGGLPSALLADVEVILRNSRHLASLVDDVLDLSQVEAGQMSLSKEWASLAEIAEEALTAVRPLCEAKGLELELRMPDELPPLFCDRTRIRQVLLNLVSNAARFTDEGGICVRVEGEPNSVVVSVSDSGPGIAAEDQQRIFTPFQQVDGSIRRRFGGTGLGLSISKRFVEMHDGKMWLESEPGKGSTFFFRLPLREGLAAPADSTVRWLSVYHQEHPRTRPSKAPMPRPLPRLVILEQGNVLQRLFARYLDGAEVIAVRTYEQAIAELNRSPAEALIINDPAAERGPGLLRQASSLPYGTPVIACWVPGEKEAAAHLGVVRYLLKPVSREALCGALDSLGGQVRTILLVDDDPEVLQLFGRLLASTRRGYRLLRASSGERALRLLRERKPDMMLLDLVMPGMDGYVVLQEKAQDAEIREIPVIAISAVDPVRESIISNSLTLLRGGGLTLGDLLICLRTWSEIMTRRTALDQGPPGNRAG
jgi:signal transduction histidine kinase/CheY-like chemotaxis protein